MINCKLYKDISLSTSGGNGCMLNEVNVGIQDGLYVFNLDEIDGLIFKDDSRPDYSLFVDTIITQFPYYKIDATNLNFNEEYEDHYYSQTLTADINSVRNEIEEILQAAVHGRYVVAFKVIGNEHYKLVGWKEGLSLDDELTISTDNNSFKLTFTGRTSYPMMEADKTNFNLPNKTYAPIYEPLFVDGEVICEDGWAVAKYVVKVNAAGQALDKDNKLVEYSGLQQAAYKLEGVDDGDYYIIGTYQSEDTIDGKVVKRYDARLCSVSGTISVSPTSITVCSLNEEATITVTSTNEWELITYPSYTEISMIAGNSGNTIVHFYSTEVCGQELVVFRNRASQEMAGVLVRNDRITIDGSFVYENGTEEVTLTPILCGEYDVTTSVGDVTINDDSSFTISNIPTSSDEQTIEVNVSYGDCESKDIELTILGNNESRQSRIVSEWCEIID